MLAASLLTTSFFGDFVLQLEMEDGDEIDAMLHQTGGALTRLKTF